MFKQNGVYPKALHWSMHEENSKNKLIGGGFKGFY